jgi:hypothetical protein
MRAAACARGIGRVVHADEFGGRTIVAGGRSNPAPAREIRHICVAITKLPQERDVLPGHVIECGGSIPGFEREAGIYPGSGGFP